MLQDSDSPLPWRPWQWAESWHGPLKESRRERIAVYCTPKDVQTSSSRVFHEHSIMLRHHHILHSVSKASMDTYLLKKPRKDYTFSLSVVFYFLTCISRFVLKLKTVCFVGLYYIFFTFNHSHNHRIGCLALLP